ncbi:MAG: hypothetical protein Q4F23_06915, partial [Coriobacteriia bacterium]|nr:hypothetical protein [Coriobacteriia bacterium]
ESQHQRNGTRTKNQPRQADSQQKKLSLALTGTYRQNEGQHNGNNAAREITFPTEQQSNDAMERTSIAKQQPDRRGARTTR